MSVSRLAAGALLLVGMVGCTVGPNYQMPGLRVPALWSEAPHDGVTTQPPQITKWWRTFNDPMLDALVERAVQANLVVQHSRTV
jgi:outer membrane protein TolC